MENTTPKKTITDTITKAVQTFPNLTGTQLVNLVDLLWDAFDSGCVVGEQECDKCYNRED